MPAAKPRSTAARAPSSPRVPTKKVRGEPTQQKRTIVCICLVALGLFLLISLTLDVTGVVGVFLRGLALGLLGGGAYLLPFGVAYIGVVYGFLPKKNKKIICASALVIIISSALHLFVPQPADAGGLLAALYTAQAALSGGVLGGLITCGLRALSGVVGATIVIVVAGVSLFVMATGITFRDLFTFFTRVDDSDEDHENRKKDAQPLKDKQSTKPPRKDFNIDMPVADAQLPPPGQGETGFVPEPPAASMAATGVFGFDPNPARGAFPAQDSPPWEVPASATTPPAQPAARQPAPVTMPPITPMRAPKPASADEFVPPDELVLHKESGYTFPPLSLLGRPKDSGGSLDAAAELQRNADNIVGTLRSFGVETTITNISRGPTVTRYELSPSVGVKISRITSLSDDLALSLAAEGVRIEAPIPGKAAVGVEVPNKNVNTVYIRDVVGSAEFKKSDSKLSFALGMGIGGDCVVGDIARMPHMLIAGATGSGKSVCINSIIVSILYKSTPEEVRLVMIDPKVVELAVYNGIPHLITPVVTDPKKAAGALQWAVSEMNRRYKLFADKGVRDLRGYNKLVKNDDELSPEPQIVIIIDELADLMMAAPGDVEDSICRLAQMARAAGMHLVIATQRPSVDVITGIIKANIPSRIAFAVKSMVDSRTILDMGGADKLLGRGDMLYYPVGAPKPIRLQACFISDKEVEAVTAFVKGGSEADYDDETLRQIELNAEQNVRLKGVRGSGRGSASDGDAESPGDEMLPAAIEIAVDTGEVSTSMLQRRLKLGYARAGRLVDEMEQRGIVGPYQGSKPRQVLISREQWQEMTMRE